MELFTNFKTNYQLTSSSTKILLKKYKKMNEVTLKQINDYESILERKKYMKVVILGRFGNEIIRIY